MGTDCFYSLKAPEMFSFQFVFETVTIFDGENQNSDPSSRFEIVDVPNYTDDENDKEQQGKESRLVETPKDGKKKRKGNDKKKAKDKGAKKKPAPKSETVEKPATVTKRKHIYLPPLRISLRYFFNRTATVEQTDLPYDLGEKLQPQDEAKPIDNLAFDKVTKGKGKKGKKEKRGKRDKRGNKPKGNKKKDKEVKPQEIQRDPSIQWVSDDYYSPEELSWRLPSEVTFKRGLNITFPATCEQMIFWLQRGPIKTSVYRWKGYGDNIPIGTANLFFDASGFIELILKKAQKSEIGPVSCRADDVADIVNSEGKKIGEINAFFILICNGGTVISEYLISEKGIFDFLGEEVDEKKKACESCGKFGSNYEYELMEDKSIAVVPDSVFFDNSPFLTQNKYKEYAEALFEILTSHNPVSQFGQYIENVVEIGIPSADKII